MLNLIGEGLAKGAQKAIKEGAEEIGEKAVSKVAKKASKKTRAEVLTEMFQNMTEKYGRKGSELMSMYGDGKRNSTLSKILSGEETQSPLVMYHAVDSKKLAELADQIGRKVPNPSLQIVDPEKNVGGNFGDVILLGNKDMAFSSGKYGGLDTRKTNIYGRDIYSRRRPVVSMDGNFFNKYDTKYEVATPENISRYMNSPPVRGSEGVAGPGSVAAQVTPQFKSLSDVIENAGRIVDRDTAQKANDQWTDTLLDSIDEMRKAQNVDVYLNNAEYMRAIQGLLGNKKAVASGFEVLPKEGYEIFNNDVAKRELRKLAEIGEALPTDYFELKANRPIDMSEFSGAILPEDFGRYDFNGSEKKVLEFLEQNNVPIVDRYFVGANGSSEKSKQAIFRKLAKQDRLKTPYLLGLGTLLGAGALMENKKKEG